MLSSLESNYSLLHVVLYLHMFNNWFNSNSSFIIPYNKLIINRIINQSYEKVCIIHFENIETSLNKQKTNK